MTPLSQSEPLRFGVVLRCALACAGVLLFFTNVDSYMFAVHAAPPPVRWVYAFAGAAAVVLVVNLDRPMPLLRSPLLAWTCFFLVLTSAWALWMRNDPEVMQELRDRYRSILFLLTFAVLFDQPRVRRAGVVAVVVAVVGASVVNVAEVLGLVALDGRVSSGGRSGGFYINPNGSGHAIALGVAIAATSVPKAWRVPLILVSAAGVATTFSRGAIVCLAVVFLWLIWRRALGAWSVVLVALCAFALLLYGVVYLQAHDLLNEENSGRLRFANDDSGRIGLALKAWEMFVDAPLLGNGLGSTRIWGESQRAHNMFLTLAADHGLLGLIAFPALGAALVVRNRGAACFALALMATGFFSHDILDSRMALLLMALAAANAGSASVNAAQERAAARAARVPVDGDGGCESFS